MEQIYTFGETCTLTAIPDSCCVFSHWVDDRDPCVVYSTEPEITVQVTDNMHFHAVMAKKMATVNVFLNFPDLGETTGSGTYECGSEVTITATTNCCNQIEWRDDDICNDNTPDEVGVCPDCSNTISCTFVVTDNITVYADITPTMHVALTKPCPENGGNTGVLQTQIPGIIPNFNGVPCYEYSGDGEHFFSCMPVTFVASPNSGYEFLGWASVTETDFYSPIACKACNFATYTSIDRIFTTDLCNDMYMIACFRRHYLVRMTFVGCCAGMVTYSVSGGEEMSYSNPFFVNDGDGLYVNFQDDDKCCKIIRITVNGEEQELEPITINPVESDLVIEFESETTCNTVTMVIGGDCESDGVMMYSNDNGETYEEYTGPIENVLDESSMWFRFEPGQETPCCEFSFWRVYSGGTISTRYSNPIEISPINSDTNIVCMLEYTEESHTLTIDRSDVVHQNDYFNFIVEDVTTGEFFGQYNCPGNEFQLEINKCHKIKIYVTTKYTDYLQFDVDGLTNPHINWITGRLLDENDNEYDGYIHGFMAPSQDGDYFEYDRIQDEYVCLTPDTAKSANAMILELSMDVDHTVKFDFSAASKYHSNNQSYYYNDGIGTEYTEDATYSDFNCPFIENCVEVSGIHRICD